MKARLIFSAAAAFAACAVSAQEPALPSRAAEPAEAPLSHPPISEAELLRQIDAIGGAGPVTTLPKVAPKKGGASSTSAAENGNGTTEITANEGAFDSRNHVAVFLRDAQDQVFVENPDFTVKCDKLTAYLRHSDKDDAAKGVPSKPKPKAVPAPASAPSGKVKVSGASSANASLADRNALTEPNGPAAGDKSAGGLEKAVCEGEVLITQDKIDPDGTLTHNTGRSRMAVYDADTGNITLTGNPQVDQGINSCISLSDSTRIILNRNGKMNVYGPHKDIIRDAGSTPSSASSSPAPGTPAVANAR